MQLYLKYAKEKIKIADKPFAGGGEGNLYRILSPSNMQGYVAKLYHPFKLSPQRLAKIEFLYQNPPDEQASNAHPTFIWVKDILLDANKSFVGLIMPFVKGELKTKKNRLPQVSRLINSYRNFESNTISFY
jgi:DNA-binding helix-hairpin-helix protein with protein kinase domain